jgi:hypothetical protein
MSVASWLRSVFTTQDPATYKAAIDGNFTIVERMAAMFAPQQTPTPTMTVQISAGMVFDSGTLTEVALQTTGAFTAPATNPRIDRVVLDQRTGVFSVVAGTPAVDPVAPAITAGKMPCMRILLRPSSAVITNAMITDERAGGSVSQAVLSVLYSTIDSQTLTGIPRAPTAAPANNSTQLATTAYADAAVAALLQSGTRVVFQQSTAPTGWIKDITAALDDTALRIVTGTVGSGGSVAFSAALVNTSITGGHTLTLAEIPSHAHGTIPVAGANVDGVTTYGGGTGYRNWVSTDVKGGGGAHTHPLTLGVKYNDVIIASKS